MGCTLLSGAMALTSTSRWTSVAHTPAVRRAPAIRRIPLMMAPSDEAMINTVEGGRGGMFTSSNPEDRRIVAKNKGGRASFKVPSY